MTRNVFGATDAQSGANPTSATPHITARTSDALTEVSPDGRWTPNDVRWMEHAIALSQTALYVTAPNPRVACLIVRDERLVASGVTQKAGGPHAEIMALRQAAERGGQVEGATIYVTLEPCSHHGRTPPCVEALLAARPARVVIALKDPNPLVAGRGVQRLRDAGISVTTGICVPEALAVNPGFVSRMTRQTPWVWLKSAASLDGRTALSNGVSQWITGADARADGHHWRARSCVVLTGVGTVLADDPKLTVRDVQTPRQPIRAVVDTRFQIPEQAQLFDGGPVWLFTSHIDQDKASRLAERNVQVVPMPRRGHHVDLRAVLEWMGRHEVNEVHVEAGSVLNGAFLQAELADELLVYTAPAVLGEGMPMFQLGTLHALEQAHRFEFVDVGRVGADVRLRARRQRSWQSLLNAVQANPGAA